MKKKNRTSGRIDPGKTLEMAPGNTKSMAQETLIKEKLSHIERKILVMSGKGGVGKSTVAAYIALLLSQKGKRVGLLDVDLHGPSIPRLLNIQGGLEIQDPGQVRPHSFSENLNVVSIEMVMGDKDTAVIWRGPLKISAIRQFITDIEWGSMDYLIIDSPPGTGDEPLTVVQTITDAEALIVTTPQEISLADVRKSINFCRQVNLGLLGIIENMGGFACPHCSQRITIFGTGAGILATISFLADDIGLSLLDINDVIFSAPFGVPITPITVSDGSVNVASVPEPITGILFIFPFCCLIYLKNKDLKNS